MTVREWDFEPVRGRVRKPMYAVCQEIVILPLFAVRDDRRSRGFKPFDGVSNCLFVERGKGGVLAIDLGEFLDEIRRPRNAANGLRGYGDQGRLSVGHAYTSQLVGVFGLYPHSLVWSSRFCDLRHSDKEKFYSDLNRAESCKVSERLLKT